jgi:hypothetical protein
MSTSQTDHGIEPEALKQYLEERSGVPIQIQQLHELRGQAKGATALKQFGYGRPLLVEYRVNDRPVREVFHRIRRNAFGRERDDDRAAAVWLDFHTFNHLPRHVPAVDVVVRTREGKIASIHSAEELLLVTAYRPGHLYADDLVRIRDGGSVRRLDAERAAALAAYLAEIHGMKHKDPTLWRRRLRDLVGHGEGIMGLTDSYPASLPYVTEAELRSMEELANRWRWRLKPLSHRLRQVHGDFHPFNLRPDYELAGVVQPWLAWRAMVLASPVWYPTIAEGVRRKLLTFARRVLSTERYDYERVNQYLEET